MLRTAMSLRLVLLIAAAGTGVGALIMFWLGGASMAEAAVNLFQGKEAKHVTAEVMAATDTFLFGIVLVIFTYAIIFGFVFQLPREKRRKLPAWMRPTGMHELKSTLVGAVLVYLVVDFATDWAEVDGNLSWESLVKPISILLLSAALWLFTGEGNPDADEPIESSAPPQG